MCGVGVTMLAQSDISAERKIGPPLRRRADFAFSISRRVLPGASILEDAVAPGSDEAGADDENDAKKDLPLDELNDANYGENHGDNP